MSQVSGQWLWVLAAVILAASQAPAAAAPQAAALVRDMGLVEVAATLDEAVACAAKREPATPRETWQAQALLACLGMTADPDSLRDHPQLGRLFDPGVPQWLVQGAADVSAFETRLYAALEAELSQGFNIVPIAEWPVFDPQLTVVYGHSDWRHVRQLVALLLTRGLVPRITPVIKKSAFYYHDDWGEPSRPLRRLNNGRRVVDQLEFDLFLEFDAPADVDRFAALVTRYAKKDAADEPGLLHGSWWQPFYRTMAPRAGGHRLAVLLITFRGYRTNLISLPEQAAAKLNALVGLDSEWAVDRYDIWVNPGFYRNMLGDHR